MVCNCFQLSVKGSLGSFLCKIYFLSKVKSNRRMECWRGLSKFRVAWDMTSCRQLTPIHSTLNGILHTNFSRIEDFRLKSINLLLYFRLARNCPPQHNRRFCEKITQVSCSWQRGDQRRWVKRRQGWNKIGCIVWCVVSVASCNFWQFLLQ